MFLDAILLELNTAVIALKKGNLNCFLKEGNVYTNTRMNREHSYKRSVSILLQKNLTKLTNSSRQKWLENFDFPLNNVSEIY